MGGDRLAELYALARVSLGHWGYDREFLDSCSDSLRLTESDIKQGLAFVLEKEIGPGIPDAAAFAYVRPGESDEFVLTHFYVDPTAMGQGQGRRLWSGQVMHLSFNFDADKLVILSDPNAVGFFEKMGAVQTGRSESALSPTGWRVTLECAPDGASIFDVDGGIFMF